MQQMIGPELLYIHHDSVFEQGRAPISAINCGNHKANVLDADAPDRGGSSRYGVDSKAEALAIIRGNGWADGAKRVADAMGRVGDSQIDAPRSIRRRRQWASDGGDICIDRLRAGDLDRMYQGKAKAQTVAKGRILRLFATVSGSVHEQPRAMFWAGAAALYLIDTLEGAGYRVEAYAAFASRQTFAKKRLVELLSTTRIKSADEPASPDQLASTLCLAGYFRLYGFHTILTAPWKARENLGSPMALTPKLLGRAGLWQSGDMVLPALRTPGEAQQFVKDALQGVTSP